MKIPKVTGNGDMRVIYIEQDAPSGRHVDKQFIELTPEMIADLCAAMIVASAVVGAGFDFPLPAVTGPTKQ